MDYHLVSVNAELELDDMHDITLRPILFNSMMTEKQLFTNSLRLIVHMKHHNRIVLSTMNSMNPSLYCS